MNMSTYTYVYRVQKRFDGNFYPFSGCKNAEEIIKTFND